MSDLGFSRDRLARIERLLRERYIDTGKLPGAMLSLSRYGEPAYETVLGLLGGEAAGFLARSAVVIAEHRRKDKLEDGYGRLERTRLLEQGDAALSFYAITTAEHDLPQEEGPES